VAHVGLIVNPSAGRDIRRLTGGASVVDNYAKRRVAECVLGGLTAVPEPPSVGVMPDRVGIADHAVGEAPEAVDAAVLELSIEETAADTRNAAARFRDSADAVVVLGGDGTTRDVAAIGFEAVRALIPSGQPLTFGSPTFGDRARSVPEQLGFEPALERDHHPFP